MIEKKTAVLKPLCNSNEPSVLLQFKRLSLQVIRRKKLGLNDIASVVFLLLKPSRTDPIIYIFLKKRGACAVSRDSVHFWFRFLKNNCIHLAKDSSS